MFKPFAAALALCALPAWAEDVTVFAAASLKTALDEIATEFETRTGDTVRISYAGSGALAQQIRRGAPADVFISANTDWMQVVADDGLVLEQRDMLGNRLVLIAHGDEPPIDLATLPNALGDSRLAMALVNAVPAGQYGKSALDHLGLWDQVSPQVAQTDNVRAALSLVSLGEAPFGIVYASDAKADDGVSVVAGFPEESHQPIRYPAALLSETGRGFYTALASSASAQVFAANGFEVLE